MRRLLQLVVPIAWVLSQPGLGLGARQSVAQGTLPLSQPTPVQARSPANASYTLSASLDTLNNQIAGDGTLRWRNISSRAADELRFHLYWNAWRDTFSSYMREYQQTGVPPLAFPDGERALIDLTSLRLTRPQPPAGSSSTIDLLPGLRYIAPDDGNTADRTLAAVALPQPVGPGETVEITFKWLAHVPRTFDRTGVLGDYYFIAQWFPKIGVLTDMGWKARQFHLTTEFFADFGTYDVRLTVPSGWTVGATGREVSRTDEANGTTSHRYVARDVHDFAWTTSPDFIDLRQEFERAGQPPIHLRLLLQPEHRRQAERHWAATRAALEHLSAWIGPYPHDALTVVDPAAIVDPWVQGTETGGMEYPTLVTAGSHWTLPDRFGDLEDVVMHEIGHQFFQGVVATNEVDHAWMDEGLTTYANSRLMAEVYGGRFVRTESYFGGLVLWPYEDVPWTRGASGDGSDVYRRAPAGDVPASESWRYDVRTGRILTYYRTTLWLHTLERLIGWEAMQRILSSYYQRFAWSHPAPEDFFRVATETSGRDLTWFFDAVQGQASTFDYAVGRVTHLPVENGSFDAVVTVRRLGTGVFPVDVRVTFADGSTATEAWDGRDPWKAFRFRRGARVTDVDVDPDHVLRLDVQRTNNSWTTSPQAARVARAWSVRWWTWLQHQMLTYAFFV